MRPMPIPLPRRRVMALAAAALAAPWVARAAAGGEVAVIGGRAFGTLWRMAAPGGSGIEALGPDAAAILAGIDRQMSPWRVDSDVSRFNRAAAGDHALPADTLHVARAALALARESGGHFDPTVGPLVARWGFGPIDEGAPGVEALSAGQGVLSKGRAEVTLDLCGIAKGWAVDRLAALTRERGIEDALIEIGGDVAAMGRHPEGRPWRVAVENPVAPGAALVLALPGLAVATSGQAAQGYSHRGLAYGHVIAPHLGAPARGALLSVTVAAPDAMAADGWATALFAAGAEAGAALAQGQGIAALFIEADGAGLRLRPVGGMGEIMV